MKSGENWKGRYANYAIQEKRSECGRVLLFTLGQARIRHGPFVCSPCNFIFRQLTASPEAGEGSHSSPRDGYRCPQIVPQRMIPLRHRLALHSYMTRIVSSALFGFEADLALGVHH